jgi:hypothetical protein
MTPCPPRSQNPSRLLVVECHPSQASSGASLQTAWEYYNSRCIRLLRYVVRKEQWPPDLDLILVSSRYGAIEPSVMVDNYIPSQFPHALSRLQHVVHRSLMRQLQSRPYKELLVLATGEFSPIRLNTVWYPSHLKIRIGTGPERSQVRHLCEWLREPVPPRV